MEIAITLLFVLVVCDVIMSQRPFSPECKTRPQNIVNVSPADCCPMPDLFPWESIATCGVEDPDEISFPSLRGSPDCEQRKCLFRNHDLLFDNDDVDYESFKQYLDEWTSMKIQYIRAVTAAKDTCLSGKKLFTIPSVCPIDTLLLCVNSIILHNCPHWKNSEVCSSLKSYYEDCVPYYQ